MVPSTVIYNEYLQKVRRFLRHHEMVLGGEHVLLAVSGGVDSIALLDMMARIAPELKLQLGVAHFDHGLRGEAAHRDAAFVVEQAKLRGIKTYVGRGDVKKLASEYKLSVEEAGRKARYAFFKRVAQKHRYSVVMTGHNANDNAETLLMNLLRGSGVKGLAAIPPVRSLMRGVVLARPLLEFERELIEGYAREMDIEWSEDETNRSPQFLRNRIRGELLPLMKQFNPSIVGTLASTANIMQCLEQYISQTVEHAIERVVTDRTKESLALKLNQLKHYLPAMQTEIVQRSVSDVFEIPPISYGAIERTLGLMWKESGSKAEIGNGITALRDRETLEVRRELPPPPPIVRTFRAGETVQVGRTLLRTTMVAREVAQPGTISTIEFVDAAKLSGELVIRTWREGDRFRPFGMDGEKKLSDFLIDRKVPLDKKARILVVANGPEIVWVCGMRLDDRYRITPETEQVLRMELEVAADPAQRQPQGRGQQQQGRGPAPRGARPQSPLQGPERGGDGRRDDRRGERRDDERREDDRREGASPRNDERPRDRREGERREGDRREADRSGEAKRNDDRRGDDRRRDDRRTEDRRPDERRADERSSEDRRSDERKVDDRRSDERRSDDRKVDERKGDDRRSDERRSDDRRSDERKTDDRRSEERRPDDRKSDDRRTDDRRQNDRRSDDRRSDDRRGDDRRSDDRRQDNRRPDDRRPDDRPTDERPPVEGRNDERRNDERRTDDNDRQREPRQGGDRQGDDRSRRDRPREGRGEERGGRDRQRDDRRDASRGESSEAEQRPDRERHPSAREPESADMQWRDRAPDRSSERRLEEGEDRPAADPALLPEGNEAQPAPTARLQTRREPPKKRDEPDWGEELPHQFGDEEYDRGAAPEPPAPSSDAESTEDAPRESRRRGPREQSSRRARPVREPRVAPDVIDEQPRAESDASPAPAAEASSEGNEEPSEKKRSGSSRGGRGRGSGRGRGGAGRSRGEGGEGSPDAE